MAWGRKKRGGNPRSVEDRYRALARLVTERGFAPQGLVLIEIDGGFLVRGVRDTGGRGGVLVASDTIAAEELLAAVEDLHV